ncbi:MAG: hypothetical protein IJK02_08415 [Clostridia bacterium]|nr:hypothetical protein [Clostridia bacterium]
MKDLKVIKVKKSYEMWNAAQRGIDDRGSSGLSGPEYISAARRTCAE